jgi:membrane fusion protein, multidrug efflux system
MRIVDRRLVLALLMVVVASCGRRKAVDLPPASGAGAAPLPALPQVEPSNEGTVVAPTEGRTTGTTYPRAESQIGPNAGGVIDKIFVKEGDKVRRGMVLFRQDPRDAQLRVSQARAALASAEVNVKASQTEYDRTKMMYDQKAVNQMQWDQMVARLDGAKVGVDQAKVALEMAQKSLSDTTVHSPLDGVVTAKLEAKVVRVNPAVDPRSRTVEVVATIPNADRALKSGLLATVVLPSGNNGPPGGPTR